MRSISKACIITFVNLGVGFIILVFCHIKLFIEAFSLIFLAMILDSLDGFIARTCNEVLPLGRELDSLADLVTFGISPCILLISYMLPLNSKSLIALVSACIFYTCCGAYRLARFNISSVSLDFFTGMPIPAAAALCQTLILMPKSYILPKIICLILAGILMASEIKYPSFKVRNQVRYFIMLICVFPISTILLFTVSGSMLISLKYSYIVSVFTYALLSPIMFKFRKR